MKSGGSEIQFGNSLVSSETRLLLDFPSAVSRVGPSSTGSRMAVPAIRFEFQAMERSGRQYILNKVRKKKRAQNLKAGEMRVKASSGDQAETKQ